MKQRNFLLLSFKISARAYLKLGFYLVRTIVAVEHELQITELVSAVLSIRFGIFNDSMTVDGDSALRIPTHMLQCSND